MAYKAGETEIKDNVGTTEQFRAAISSETSVPAVADKLIDEFIVQNCDDVNDLELKIGDETNFWTIKKCGGHIAWTPKGDVKQIKLTPTAGTITYEAIINFSECD